MASGSFSNNVGQNCNLIISWNSVKGQGGSTVNATLIAQNRNGWYFDAVVYGYGITINGSQVTGSGARLSASSNGSAGLISHSVWVPYTGDKSITISGYANFNGIINLSNQSISGTVALDKIGSAPTMGSVTAPTTSVVSEKTTSITVRWNKATSYNNSVTYAIGCSINGGSYEWRYPDNNINTTSYTWDIGTPTQGATYQFAVCCTNDIARSDYKYSGTVTINKLSPPTIGTISTFNPYVNNTLTVPLSGGSQTNGSGFTRRADIHVDGAYKYAGTAPSSNGNTSVGITVDAASIASDLGSKAYSSSSKFTVEAWCENSNGTRSSYVSKTFAVNINSDGGATPTLSLPTLSGGAFNNAATCFIVGISTLNVSSPAASLRRAPSGTTISYNIACTGATTQNSQNASFSGLTAGMKTITVTATDSRGLSVSVSKQVVVQSCAAPTIRAFTATRLDDPNTSAKLVYTLAYSPIYQYTDVDTKGNQLNGILLQQYKKDNFDWTTASNELVLTNLETDSTYTIQLRIADKVNTNTYVTATQVIPTIKTTMAWRSWGVGIGCIPQTSYALEVNGSSKISGSLDASNMLQVNSNGVAIGKASEKSAFEVNMDSYLYGNETVSGKLQTKDFSIYGKWVPGYKYSGNGNSAGYMRLCRLKITGTYTNGPIELCYSQRSSTSPTVLEIRFENVNGLDPDLVIFRYKGYCRAAYIVKVSTSTWDIYVTKSEAWDYIAIHYWTALDTSIEMQFIGENATSVPNGWIQAANFYMVELRGRLYPVGAVYITYNNNNPGNFLGGSWVQFGQGRTLMGQGTCNDGFTSMSFTANSTGGKYESRQLNCADSSMGLPKSTNYSERTIVRDSPISLEHSEINAHISLMQPYITVYFWRRTA